MSTGIYVHIPFCVSKCAYCDFYSAPCQGKREEERYTDALCRQIKNTARKVGRQEVETVFFGGGTPSLLSEESFLGIISAVRDSFDVRPDAEITVEANPGTLTKEKLRLFTENGVNRLSLGVQSFSDEELETLSRIHSAKEAEEAFLLARDAGINNISLDLMYGIPGQTAESFERTLRKTVSLSPEHISVYGLQLEEGTPFFRNRERYVFPDEDEVNSFCALALGLLTESGYARYEISNYARAGFECRHNLGYWNMKEYLGFGPGAHSFFGGRRFFCTKDTGRFIASSGDGMIVEDERPDAAETEREYVMLRLRLVEGLPLGGNDGYDVYLRRAEPFIRAGFMENDGHFLHFTPKGFDVSNAILSEILFE